MQTSGASRRENAELCSVAIVGGDDVVSVENNASACRIGTRPNVL
jgi:hypothetical protein